MSDPDKYLHTCGYRHIAGEATCEEAEEYWTSRD